jgi:hypothetical protein
LRQQDGRLPDILQGADEPASIQEYFEFATLCGIRGHYLEALRLYEHVHQRTPMGVLHYPMACAAIRAANGEGRQLPDVKARANLRNKALEWLRTELTVLQKAKNDQAVFRRKHAEQTLRRWCNDLELRSVREVDALATLPEEERPAWQLFWDEVRLTLQEVSAPLAVSRK